MGLVSSFNRTFMELKWLNDKQIIWYNPSFNRTFMELKLFRDNHKAISTWFQSYFYGIEIWH